jgi:antitoxin MazE
MATVIKTRIIKIGNSQGIRLPKLLLDQTNLGEEVELELQESQIVIRPSRTPRQNWEEQFQQMAAQGDDQLFDSALLTTTWDEEEWEW